MAVNTDQWRRALALTHPAQPLTPDAQYLAELGANAAPVQQAQAALPGQIASASAEYGYATDPSGAITGVDASNPYSRAALLQRTFEQTRRGSRTNLASAGQLYSGAAQNAENAAFTNFNQASAQNRRGFQDLIGGYISNVGALGMQKGQADVGSLGGLTERASNDPNQPDFAPSPLPRVKSTFKGFSYKTPRKKK